MEARRESRGPTRAFVACMAPSRRVRRRPISCRSVPAASTLDRSIMLRTRTDVRDPRGRRADRAGRRAAPRVGAALRGGAAAAPAERLPGLHGRSGRPAARVRPADRRRASASAIWPVRPREDVLARARGARARRHRLRRRCWTPLRAFDRERLEGLVAQQLALRGLRAFATEIVLPLAQSVGDLWALGKIPIAAEHLASEVVLHALKGGLRMSRGTGPLVVGRLPRRRASRVGLPRHAGRDPGRRLADALSRRRPSRAGGGGGGVDAGAEGRRPERQRPDRSCGSTFRRSRPCVGKLPPRTMAVIGGGGAESFARMLRGYGFRVGLEAFARPATS